MGADGLLPARAEEAIYAKAIDALAQEGVLLRIDAQPVDVIGLNPSALVVETRLARLVSAQGKRGLTVPADSADALLGMPCLDAPQEIYSEQVEAGGWLAKRFSRGDLRRVFSAEHTGLLQRDQREALELRFKAKDPRPWYENLLSATPTLEMGVDIGDLSSVLLCSVPPNQASYLQRIGRAGRRDGNAFTATLADGASPHDLYFFEDTDEMLQGEVVPPEFSSRLRKCCAGRCSPTVSTTGWVPASPIRHCQTRPRMPSTLGTASTRRVSLSPFSSTS